MSIKIAFLGMPRPQGTIVTGEINGTSESQKSKLRFVKNDKNLQFYGYRVYLKIAKFLKNFPAILVAILDSEALSKRT